MVLAPGKRERRVFVDTSAYLALLARNDQYHQQAAEILQVLLRERALQLTTNIVVIEAHALILSTLGIGPGQAFLRAAGDGGTTIVRSRASDEERARGIIYQYDDKDFRAGSSELALGRERRTERTSAAPADDPSKPPVI